MNLPEGYSTWDNRFLTMAILVATWSKDPDCKVGCVIVNPDRRVVSTGYNGFPVGVPDLYDTEAADYKARKLMLTIHAEMNAILNNVSDLRSCTLYCTFEPCFDCAKAIVQSGIKRVVCPFPNRAASETWKASQDEAQRMFTGTGVLFSRSNHNPVRDQDT